MPIRCNLTLGSIIAAKPEVRRNNKNELITLNPRAAIYLNNEFMTKSGAIQLTNFTSRDQVAVSLKVELAKGIFRNLIVCSLYVPSDVSTSKMITDELIKLISYCKRTNSDLIIGSDCNSHHSNWGSKTTDPRGRRIARLIDQNDLNILNIGDKPTFIRNRTRKGSPESIVDKPLFLSATLHLWTL